MKKLEIHPLADRLPDMPEDQFKKFKEDISGLGVLEPIILLDGKILDGRHRYRACLELGIECPSKTVKDLSPNDLVRSMNLCRRHLNSSQRSMVGVALLEPFEIEAKKAKVESIKAQPRSNGGSFQPSGANLPLTVHAKKSAEKVAESLNVGARSIKDAKVVTNEATPEEIKSVTNGKAAVSTTAKKVRERRPPAKEKKKAKGRMNATNENIGWAAYSWNPISGCKHGCPYCYAQEMSDRFKWSFEPQFHEDRLTYPGDTKIKEGKNNRVFVCSMGELFGPWVPNEWIEKVFECVRQNPQWTFLFLTKSPERLPELEWPENAWIGATIDTQQRVDAVANAFEQLPEETKFISCEPLLEKVVLPHGLLQSLAWLIIGAKSEGQHKVQPESEWVESLFHQARSQDVPVWFKDNLIFRPQETPATK